MNIISYNYYSKFALIINGDEENAFEFISSFSELITITAFLIEQDKLYWYYFGTPQQIQTITIADLITGEKILLETVEPYTDDEEEEEED